MTDLLYNYDAYLSEFSAEVISCVQCSGGYEIILDKTAFFPEGGGQKSDTGMIGDSFVSDVQFVNGTPVHFCDKSVEKGSTVSCKINEKLRFKRMQLHSGEHIVSGILHKKCGVDNVGFHMDPDCAVIDFNAEIDDETLSEAEFEANEVIWQNRKITAFFPPENELDRYDYRSKLDLTENVRLVEIDGVDLCACCAPHVGRTGEVGIIKFISTVRHRGGIRIVIKAGSDAFSDYVSKHAVSCSVAEKLSLKPYEIADGVDKLYENLNSEHAAFSAFKMNVAENDRNNLEFINGCSVFITSVYDSDMMRSLSNYGKGVSRLSAVFSGDDESGYSYFAASDTEDIVSFGKIMNSSLNGRGGGRNGMISGKVLASADEIKQFFKDQEQ